MFTVACTCTLNLQNYVHIHLHTRVYMCIENATVFSGSISLAELEDRKELLHLLLDHNLYVTELHNVL